MRFSPSLYRLQNALISSRHAKPTHSRVVAAYASRNYAKVAASQNEPPKREIAILGSGVTGLSAAWHLSIEPDAPKITIYEKSSRAGGWLQSKYVDLPDGSGSVLFETGPRNIRPAVPLGLNTIALWEDLGLAGNMIVTPKNSVAAQSRWIYYPDHLVKMPHPSQGLLRNFWNLLTEDAFKGYMKAVAYEIGKPKRADDVEDESIGDFLSRRVDRTLVDKVASAVMHGIYAGDAWQLSARSLLPDAWWAEGKTGSIMKGMMDMGREGWMRYRDAAVLASLTKSQKPSPEVAAMVASGSSVTLDGGLQMFMERLRSMLERAGAVEFKLDTEVTGISMADDGQSIEVATTGSSPPVQYEQVISTIPSQALSYMTLSESHPNSLSAAAQTPSVTVNVVNLYFDRPDLLPVAGFGYLIPQATPFKNNPELALGVVFDSDVVPVGQDKFKVMDTTKAEQRRGTKVTVMLGGHWYNSLDQVPNEELALRQARSVLKRHLNITAEPTASLVSQQKNCIPQYTVGHTARLTQTHEELLSRFSGRLKVAGSSYGGVSINDCVLAGMEVAGYASSNDWNSKSGLDLLTKDSKDYVRIEPFLRQHGLKFAPPSESRGSSGRSKR